MQDLSLHILDVAENAVRADAKTICIGIIEDIEKDQLILRIDDDGKGMDGETTDKALDPFYTTKSGKQVGLGLSLLRQAAEQTGGTLSVVSKPGEGTRITAVFTLSHPDMKPTGNINKTLVTLIAGYPSLRLIYDYRQGDEIIHFDSLQ